MRVCMVSVVRIVEMLLRSLIHQESSKADCKYLLD